MNKPKISRGILFDKILVNTFRRCISLMNEEAAEKILSVDYILTYNSTDDYYIAIDPEQYKFTSTPSFSDSDNAILKKFYGVNIKFFNNQEEKEETITEKPTLQSANGFVEILDAPKNRHLLIGFSIVLIICYLFFSACCRESKPVDNTPPVFGPKKFKKKIN